MRRTIPVLAVFVATLATAVALFATAAPGRVPEVVVHEWGTFTSVAGEDGQAQNWVPLGGPTDLPCFVEHFKNRLIKIIPGYENEPMLEYDAARAGLMGKVRMETPVLYFYSKETANLNVRVQFPRGLITEWYPTAVVNQPNVTPSILANPSVTSSATWAEVTVSPGSQAAFPKGHGDSHYYAARNTDATPVTVKGQNEKFLFYRGVASFEVPISTTLVSDREVRLINLFGNSMPTVILFENRAGKISYTNIGALKQAVTVTRPTAPATLGALKADLVRILTETGLYPKEAAAMVETWRDSWFEEGSRVFYVIPTAGVDAILPLAISPAPTRVARAFVGRMELITPESMLLVQMAVASNDTATLERYGRFLGPIAERLASRITSVSDRSRLRAVTNSVFTAYVQRFATCQ